DQKSLLDRPVKTGLLGYVIPGALEVTGSSFVADYLEVTNADLNGFPADKVWNAYRLLIGSATESDKALHPLEMDTIRRKIRFNRLVQVGALVRDLSTGLLWTRDTGRSMSFGEAQDFCRQLTIEHRG